jgi:hypothetical protein
MEKIISVIGITVIVTLVVIAAAFFWSIITWWAWNLVMPYLFHVKTISLLQAFAINLLLSLIKPTITK